VKVYMVRTAELQSSPKMQPTMTDAMYTPTCTKYCAKPMYSTRRRVP